MALLLLTVVLGAAGCRFSGFAFVRAESIHFVSPGPYSAVGSPITVAWRADPGLHFGQPSGPVRYGIFVDRAPMAPGGSLRGMFSRDKTCTGDPTCPTELYLEQHDIYLTSATSVTITNLVPHNGGKLHSIIIVLINSAGRRMGEASYTLWLKDANGQASV
jgi:hypothetical protein